ncbi:hypothetical protein AB4254_11730 [Vibrio breoganii]
MMKLYAWYNPNTLKAQLIASGSPIEPSLNNDLSHVEYIPDDLVPPELLIKNKHHAIELSIEDGLIVRTAYTDATMEHLPIGNNSEIRRHQRGKSLAAERNGLVTILRAVDTYTNTFKPMDYVIVLDDMLTNRAIKEVESYINDTGNIRTRAGQHLRWVAEHAQSVAASYGRPTHVIIDRTLRSKVFEATNTGEYFYDAPIKSAKVALQFDDKGLLIPVSEKSPEPTQ